jgi:hypothetical protein
MGKIRTMEFEEGLKFDWNGAANCTQGYALETVPSASVRDLR